MTHEVTRREAIRTAMKAGVYTAPVILAAAIPGGVSAQVSSPLSRADLAIAKTATGNIVTAGGNAIVDAGMNITFTITVTNSGPNGATGVVVQDPLPAGLVFVSASGGGVYDAATRQVQFAVGTLGVGTTPPLTIVARTPLLPSGTTRQQQTNTATVSATTLDPNPANNTASATYFILATFNDAG